MVFGHGNQGWPVELSVDHLSGINLSPHIWSIEYLLKKSCENGGAIIPH